MRAHTHTHTHTKWPSTVLGCRRIKFLSILCKCEQEIKVAFECWSCYWIFQPYWLIKISILREDLNYFLIKYVPDRKCLKQKYNCVAYVNKSRTLVTFIWYNNLHSGNFFDKKWLVYTSILSSLVYADVHFHSLLFLYINQEFDIVYGVSLKFIRENISWYTSQWLQRIWN
jgi:hypothetical protein